MDTQTEIPNSLRQFLLEKGLVDVGFTRLQPQDLQQMEHSGMGAGDCQYGISLAARLSDAVIEEIAEAPTHTYFHHYRTINAFLDQMVLQTGFWLEQHGYRYLPIAASQSINLSGWEYRGRFSHKQLACMAGLGTIGKSSLFLHKTYGPRVRLASVLTDCPVAAGQSLPESPCGSCTKCVEACPAKAISGKPWQPGTPRDELFSAQACSEYMKRQFQHIGRGAVCGICIRVCPYAK